MSQSSAASAAPSARKSTKRREKIRLYIPTPFGTLDVLIGRPGRGVMVAVDGEIHTTEALALVESIRAQM